MSLTRLGSITAALIFILTLPALAGDITTPKWKRTVAPAEPGENVAVYFSNGDNEIMFNKAPVDSPGAIDEILDVLKQAYGVKRIYWRAPQIDQIIYQSDIRYEASHHGPWLTYMDHLFADLDTGDHMIRAARERGMEVWGVASLFDHGSHASIEYPNKGMGPFFTENKIRVEHPEWIPIDRAGIRRMSGPICFAYPGARKALVDLYVRLVEGKGYNGLTFHLYTENQGPRFDDEFGFNEPIVEEYRKRYGVDILTQDYDKQKLSDLRGEYLTQFFRELRAALTPLDVKVSVMIDAKTPDLPQVWLAFPNIMLSGRVGVDWRTYAREDLIDELFVYFNGEPYTTLRMAMDEVGDTGVEFATLASAGHPKGQEDLRDAGVWRTISGQTEEFEFGYLEPGPDHSFDSEDFIARLTVLTQMATGAAPVDMGLVKKALDDPSILVRRRALRLLVTLNDEQPELIDDEAIAGVIKLLDDPENVVRCTAVNTLGHIGGSDSIPALYDAVAKHANPMMHLFPGAPLASLPDDRIDDLMMGLTHESPEVRIMVTKLTSTGAARPATWQAILDNTRHDNWLVRWNAGRALQFVYPEGANERLFEMLDDPHPTVRNIAARNLAKRLKTESRWVGGLHHATISKLTDMFASYGTNSTNDDADWGWRSTGLALKQMGPRGEEALEKFLNQTDDALLAHRAWHVLHVKEQDFDVVIISEEEAEQGYRQHPTRRDAEPTASTSSPEPTWMPYIVSDFNTAEITDGEFGNGYAEQGRWRKAKLAGDDASGDGQSLFLSAGNGMEHVTDSVRLDYRLNAGKLRIAFSVKLEQPDSGLTVWATSSNNWEGNLRVQVAGDGVSWFDPSGRSTLIPREISVGQWYRFELTADLEQGRFSISMVRDGDSEPLITNSPIANDLKYREFNCVVLVPSGPAGSESRLDDFTYEASNPFARSADAGH